VGAGRLGRPCGVAHLVFGLDRARAGDDGESPPADRRVADSNDRVVRMKLAADELVGREDRLQRFHHRVAVERELRQHPFVAERAEHDALGARHVERLQALLGDPVEQFLRRFGGCFALEDDDHFTFHSIRGKRKGPPGGRA
jgi:hypothetical protein